MSRRKSKAKGWDDYKPAPSDPLPGQIPLPRPIGPVPDENIDTSEVPELGADFFEGAILTRPGEDLIHPAWEETFKNWPELAEIQKRWNEAYPPSSHTKGK